MKRGPLIAAAACAALGVSAGYVMIPGQGEQLAMLSRDGLLDAALAKADMLFESGNREPAILLQTFAINEYAGKYVRALEAFHAYFEVRPDDAAAGEKAASLFDGQGQTELLKTALENTVRLTRDPVAAGRLAAFHRLQGRPNDEFRVLRAVEPKGLQPVDALRRAHLHFDRKEVSEGVAILEQLDDADAIIEDAGRIQLFIALLEQKKFEAAADRAIKWNNESQNSQLRDVLTGYLLDAGADSAALRLLSGAQTLTDAGEFARVAGLLSDQGRFDLAEQLLSDWLRDARKMPADKLDIYFQSVVSMAGGKRLDAKLFNELIRALGSSGDSKMQASFVQAMYAQFGYAGVAPIRWALRSEVLLSRPVLAARLMAAERNPLAARRFLFSVHLPDLSAGAQFDWLDLARQILSQRELCEELAFRAQAGAIPPELRKAVLDELIQFGSQPQIAAAWHVFIDSSQR